MKLGGSRPAVELGGVSESLFHFVSCKSDQGFVLLVC